MRFYLALLLALFCFACNNRINCPKITVDKALLDSITRTMDTTYSKRYRNKEFAVAEYYINRKDTTVCQLMKDSANRIRQILIAKRDRKIFTAEYFSNGQLKATLPLDKDGRLNGEGAFYFESGCVRSKGSFRHGFYFGEWKNFDQNWKNVSTDQYDSNGQLIKTFQNR